ncbi:hypothetical protein HS088_TW02G01011 [Tripterygium wilfordii]|uniref:Uncharacterized protein n=1 Tax=Tripterygium wilfordii TaxID=458696 RepID=A0A7J7E004_TRIWF|nr:uncharacterized protein LOC119981518 [Tripterygium wilfordii]KAF5751992.1 hypothetical protein HS088_TW02G01011 [Tripterygium wilfordii]
MPLLLRISVTLFLLLPFLLLLILLALVFLPLIFLLVLPLLFALLWVYFLFKILCIFTTRFQEMKLMHRKKKKNNKSCKARRDKEEIADLGPWVLEKENKRSVEDDVKEIDEGSWQIVAPKSAKSNETKTFKEILYFWRSKERGSTSTG